MTVSDGLLGSGTSHNNLARFRVLHLRLFGSGSVEGIVQNLKADGSQFATKQAEV